MSHKHPIDDLTIRYAFPDDAPAVAALAAVDSQPAPEGDVLVGEVQGQLWAAVSLATGQAIADPFRPTADVVALLETRARQLHAAARPRSRSAPAARLRTALRGS